MMFICWKLTDKQDVYRKSYFNYTYIFQKLGTYDLDCCFSKAAFIYGFYGLANKSVNKEGLQKLKTNGHLRVNVSKKTEFTLIQANSANLRNKKIIKK